MIKVLLLFLGLGFSYIPHSHFILKKSSDTHGKGIYQVLQEVIFQTADDRAVIQETWWVTSGNHMYLEAKGPQTSYTSLYEEQTKYSVQPQSKVGASKIPGDFFEGFFHYRNVNEFARAILRAGITSSEILSPQRRYSQLKDIDHKAQNFLRLARTNGTIAYAFGHPVSGDSSNTPSLWVEQDTFRVRRIRFKSGNEVLADDYEQYSHGLEFPRSRVINTQNMKITIRTLSINSVKPTKSFKEMLSLRAKQDVAGNTFLNTSLGENIKKFYHDFR
ncbi:MAG: hypothetical protein KDD37_09110 [Bdellovibrionales bacterium]|nr:hypothetical protein [Bdellovibrionales bacterium]